MAVAAVVPGKLSVLDDAPVFPAALTRFWEEKGREDEERSLSPRAVVSPTGWERPTSRDAPSGSLQSQPRDWSLCPS